MPHRSKTVAAVVVQGMQRGAQARGVEAAEFLRQVGLSALDVADPATRIGRRRFIPVLAFLAKIRPGPAEPKRISLDGLTAGLPMVVASWLNAPTMRSALQVFLRFRPIVGESDRVEMQVRDREVRIEYLAEDPQEFAGLQARANFQHLALLVRNYALGDAVRFSAQLTDRPSPTEAAFEAFLGGKCLTGQAANVLHFRTDELDVPFRFYNPAVAGIQLRALDAQLAALEHESSCSLQVERAVRKLMAARGWVEAPGRLLEGFCAEMGMSRSSLQRKLACEGTTFQQIWTAARVREAKQLLSNSSLSMSEISDRVGFARQSTFTRFFRREVQVSPLRYRRNPRSQA